MTRTDRRHRRPARGLLAAVLLLAAPGRGAGQTPARDTARPPPPDTAAPIPLAPVRVTVLRTPFRIDRAPFAVAALGEEDVRRGRVGLALDEALRGVPGVQVENRFNVAAGERISIRGFGARSQFGVRGVAVVVDGIPATLPDGQTTLSHVDPGALGRVEVIRGPASALYGNAAGGAVVLESPPPPAVPLRAVLRGVTGSLGLRRLEGRIGGRVGETGYGAFASRVRIRGFREHSGAELVRGTARVEAPAAGGLLRLTTAGVVYDAETPGSLTDSLLALDRTRANPFNLRQETGEEGRQLQGGLRWIREGRATVEVSAWGLARRVDARIPPRVIDLARRAGGLRLALRSPRGTGGPEWGVGASVELQRDDRRNHRNEAGRRGALTLDQEEEVGAFALFSHLLLPLPGDGTLLAGLRYDRFRFRARDRLVGPDEPDDSGTRTLHAVSPAAGISLPVAPDIRLYGNVATAFETPTTTELGNRPDGAGGFNPDLRPERTVSLEVGLKGRVPGGGAVHLALYRALVRDQLLPFEVPGVPGRRFFRNAGSAVHRGAEAALAVSPAPGALLRIAYALTDARFREFETGDGSFGGRRVPGIAAHRADVLLRVEGRARGYAEVELRYASRIPVDDGNTAYSPARLLTDLRLGLGTRSLGGVVAEPFAEVRNLLDVRYNASVVVNAFGGRYYEPGPGRTVYLGAALRVGGG